MVMTLLTRPKKTVATVVIATDGSGDFNCDGTDDDIEIQAAIDSLPAGGGVVYMKEGTYNIETSIIIPNDNIELIGAGASTRITTTQNITMISATNVDRISIHLVYLYGAGAGGANYGIYFDTVTASSIDNCWVENIGQSGIYLTSSSNQNTIHNNKLLNNVGDGITLLSSCDYNNIINNISSNNNVSGLGIEDGDSNLVIGNQCNDNAVGIGIDGTSTNNIVKGNNFIHNIVGIMVSPNAHNNIINGNQVLRNIEDGIYIRSNDNIVSSNECIDNDYNNTGTYDGIVLVQADRNIISNNRCEGNDDWGINLTDGFSDDNLILGNDCQGNTAGAIQDNGTNTTIFHNLPTETLYWSCPGTNFTAGFPDVDDVFVNTGGKVRADANGITFIAPVFLPHGAVITAVEVFGNAAAAAETWTLRRENLSTGAAANMATANINTEDTTITNPTVDNNTYAYFFYTSTLDTNDEIYGARITYNHYKNTL